MRLTTQLLAACFLLAEGYSSHLLPYGASRSSHRIFMFMLALEVKTLAAFSA